VADVFSYSTVQQLVKPFGVGLSKDQVDQLLAYLELLLHWNRRISLTAIRDPEECVTRHFGESFYLAHSIQLQGRSLDIGSGPGFPGLALKIIFPELAMTLLEPVTKKRAFLKEVVRSCRMQAVEIRAERLEEYDRGRVKPGFDSVTCRAVGNSTDLIENMSTRLGFNGLLCFWTTVSGAERIRRGVVGLAWDLPLPLPGSRERVILVGRRLGPDGGVSTRSNFPF
jgi:16S rRNA (guanine527-N7)-methyltransferase